MLAVGAWCAVAQVTTEPAFITNNYTGKIIITFDPAQGNKGMVGATACYAHTGACTATQDWQCDPEWRIAPPRKIGNAIPSGAVRSTSTK